MIDLFLIPFLPVIVILLFSIERRLTKVETKLSFMTSNPKEVIRYGKEA